MNGYDGTWMIQYDERLMLETLVERLGNTNTDIQLTLMLANKLISQSNLPKEIEDRLNECQNDFADLMFSIMDARDFFETYLQKVDVHA